MFKDKVVFIDGYKCVVSLFKEFMPASIGKNTFNQIVEYRMSIRTVINGNETSSSFIIQKRYDEKINESDVKTMFMKTKGQLDSKIADIIKKRKEIDIWEKINFESLL